MIVVTRCHLFLIPILLLPWLGGDMPASDASSCEEHGVIASHEVFPFSLRYRLDLQRALELVQVAPDPLCVPVTRRLAFDPVIDPAPLMQPTGPDLCSLLMSFQT
jgi:hypothetical protein